MGAVIWGIFCVALATGLLITQPHTTVIMVISGALIGHGVVMALMGVAREF